jgi:hypothetical protein
MKNTMVTYWMFGLFFLTLVFGGLLVLPGNVDAKQELVPVEGANYNVNATLANNLRTLKGKRINVTLDSGKIMAGMLKDVGDKLIHLEKLEGREHFDALISIDNINSVDTRFRTYKR